MKKELKDYLPLYLIGSEPIFAYLLNNERIAVIGIVKQSPHWYVRYLVQDDSSIRNGEEDVIILDNNIRPIFWPLSCITEEDVANLFNIDVNALVTRGNFLPPFFQVEYIDEHGEMTYEHRYLNQLDSEQFRFLLSKRFDIFNLIEVGRAIDATTLKQKS